MRRKPLMLWLLVAAGCMGGGDWGAKEQETVITVVEAHEVGTGDVSDLLITSASVESESQADIIPTASGVVKQVFVDDGDPVTEGQVLAIVSNTGLDANASRSRAELQRLEREVAVTRELHAQGVVSQRELESLEHQLRTQQTTAMEASQSAGETKIRAPFSGVIAMRNVRVGEYASSGAAAFRVVDLERLRVVASLPERDVTRVALNQTAQLTSVYDAAQAVSGVVQRISPVVDSATGTFRVTVALDAGQEALRPGQYVNVKLEVDRHEGVVVVPKRAVVYEDGVSVVYRVKEAKADPEKELGEAGSEGPGLVAERVVVKLGLLDDEVAEVVDGIAQGEDVIVLGQNNLEDGAAIRLVEAREEGEEEG